MYFLYILKSRKDSKFYIGSTSNLEDRILRHNQGREKSTKHRIPLELYYFEKFNTRSEAIKREYYIKSLKSSKFIEKLMKGKRGGSSIG